MAHIQARRALSSIVKITSKKRQPELITFKYGTHEEDGFHVTDMHRFGLGLDVLAKFSKITL